MGEVEDIDNERLVADNWDTHLLETANSFRHQGELCDVNIVTEGGMVCMAHSCVLAAASKVLKARIQEDMDTGLSEMSAVFFNPVLFLYDQVFLIHC